MAVGQTCLRFDFTNCMSFRIGMRNGITDDDLNVMMLKAQSPKVLEATKPEEGLPGFLQALDPEVIRLDEIRQSWAAFRDEFPGDLKDLLVLGIGGSALCTLTFQAALLHPYANSLPEGHPERPEIRVHVIDNSDPWQLEGVLDLMDPKSTGVYVVSKSGTTAETWCGLGRVRDWLAAAGADWKRQTVVCTDFPGARKTPLWSLAEECGLARVGMPPQVGGRFSAFTSVGLLPALAMGIDIDEMLDGATAMAERCRGSEVITENPAFMAAAIQYTYTMNRPADRRRNICVLMPYAYRLRLVSDWFAQLWAESLGKRRSLDGAKVVCGQTPVKALGATDQHSQLQLYQDGPQDKVIIFLRVLDHGIGHQQGQGVTELSGDELQASELRHVGHPRGGAGVAPGKQALLLELLDAEYRATAFALTEAHRPNMTVELPAVTPGTIGELLMFFMMKTAITGELMNIDAFDQPGVEASKRATHALFGRAGEQFDQVREAIAEAEGGRKLVL